MGQRHILLRVLALVLCASTRASPRSQWSAFFRSAVETVPEHEPISAPIRTSVESVPLRSLRDEGDERIPLRDAVEKRPISVLESSSSYKYIDDIESIPNIGGVGSLRLYYGAASYLNNGSRTDERLQQGNANLQEMQQTIPGPSTKRLVVCYMESWAAYRAPPLAFTAGLLPKSCTHLHYAFAVLHPHTYVLLPANEDYDVVKGGYRIATGLKQRMPGLRVIISVGGDGMDRLFSEMVQEPRRRNSFIDSAVKFLQDHDFDGLDLHWRFPGEKDDKEKELLTTLLYELREKFSSYGFLLSTVLPPFRYQIEDGYDLSAVSGATDYTILHAWDMTHGKRDEPPARAVQHSALHRDPGATSRDQRYDNIEFMVKYILRNGMAADKLVLGVPLFGRSYTLAASTLPAPGAPVKGWGDEGQYTQTRGMLAYFEICMAEREGKWSSGIDEAGNSFAVYENQWVTYDTPSNIKEKMNFVISHGLAGAAAWAVDMDDFRGLCGKPFPMLSAMSTSLNGELVQTDQSTLKIGKCDPISPYLASDEDSCAHFHFCSGGINYRLICEDNRLYDPSTGYCGHQDVAKCVPGQSLRISLDDASRFLSQSYATDFEWGDDPIKEIIQKANNQERLVASALGDSRKVYRLRERQQQIERLKDLIRIHRNLPYGYWDSVLVSHTTKHKPQRPYHQYGIKNTPDTNAEGTTQSGTGKDNDKRIVCYMTSWAFYRRGDGKFVPEHIDTRLCTHVVYAYASLSPNDLVAKEFDPWADITNNLYERVTSLSDVKVLLGLGGWTDSAGDKYSRLVSSASSRAKFVEKAVAFLKLHNFKGLHLDWDYPVCWQSNCKKGAKSDKANFAKLVQELSTALHGAGMELGIALSGYKEVIESAYDLPVLSKAADFLSTMTYDYHGGWERTTAHHTPLTASPSDGLSYYSIQYAIESLIKGGADPKKLLLGLSFYGQSYRLASVEGSGGPGTPAAGPGEPGEFTKQPGMLAYYEICYRVKNLRWKTGQIDKAGPYAQSDNQWVGYDDPKSITDKVEWAMRQGLGGAVAWAMDLDDFNNRCCAEPFPLLRAAARALGRPAPAPPAAACERPPQPVTPAPPTTTPAESDGSLGGSGGHDHGSHEHSTSSTWGWNPSATTASTTQTWWAPPNTTPMTTTTSTTTTTTTTTRRPTSTSTRRTTTKAPAKPPVGSGDTESGPCGLGEYRASPGDCSGYLQCEGGQWRKHSCAPGLHWAAADRRCDWPSFAACKESPSNEASTATTTLAPMTSRPPQTTTRRSTTRVTTTTTTTTRRPTTSAPVIDSSEGSQAGRPCHGQDYEPVAGDCNAYLHCDGTEWKRQNCAPGLHWSAREKHCDWPKYAKCQDTAEQKPTTAAPKPTRPATRPPSAVLSDTTQEDSPCSGNDLHAPASTCDAYLLCVGGRWRRQLCPPGLHWDKRTSRCDWIEFAMCEMNKPDSTKSPVAASTTKKPSYTTTVKQPIMDVDHKPEMERCQTGSYYAHPKCEKFFVCVNGAMVAQSCAPGLVWNAERSQCDFPSATICNDRRVVSAAMVDATKPAALLDEPEPEPVYCNNGEYSRLPSDCTRYRHCLFGKFVEFTCSPGLHWNEDKQICDWPKNAKCKRSPATTPRPIPTTTQPIKPETQESNIPQHNHNEMRPVSTEPIDGKPSFGTSVESSKPALLNTKYKLVCYYTNWSWYRPGLGKYSPEDIDPTLCTHIVYGFAVLGDDGLITAHDSWADYDNRFYERVVEFKRYGTKVSLALGGWNDSAGDKYSKLVNDPEARDRFVRHAVEFIERYGFDGLDLDWEYPKCWQVDCSKGPDSDKQGFSELVQELSAALKPRGLLLSSAVSPNKKVIDAGYDVPVLARHLDWIAVMTYDYHGQWDKKTGHVAPLYYHPDDDTTFFNANYTIHYWMQQGAPSYKLVMGIPLYGQTFTTEAEWGADPGTGVRNKVTGLNAPAVSGGEAGEYTRAKGFLAYYEICDRIRNQGWKVVRDPDQRMGPYAFKGNQWVSFDDQEIIKKKVNFIKSLNLAGGMVWALDLDDFRNRCAQGKHPLMNTIKKGLLDPKVDMESLEPAPIPEPPNYIDDLDDIEIRPGLTKPSTTSRPMQITSKPQKPTTIASTYVEERFKVVCYYTNWAWYRPGSGKYTPSDIDPSLCTHIVYAFAVLDSAKLVMKPHDNWLDVENKFYEKVVSLKSRGVRVVLGLGGWNDSAGDKYSRLVNNPSARRKFVVHALDFIEQFGFDGLDLDWEYPRCWQVNCEKGPSSDKQGFSKLVTELHSAFAPRGLLLSAAVSASKRVIDFAYDVPTLSSHLDWIALMTYDYHGQWEKKTGHVAPMYAREDDDDRTFNTNFTIHYWIDKGAAARKLVMGVPFYGQSFTLTENAGTAIGASAFAGGEAGDETRARGFLAFYEICERIRSQGWRVNRDPGGRIGPYATRNDQWVSFDDDFMVRHKAEYARAMGLGGSMVWALDLDDFTGQYCGCGKSPLLKNINHVLRGKPAPEPCSLKEIQEPSRPDEASVPQSPDLEKPQIEEEPQIEESISTRPELDAPNDGQSLEGKACRDNAFRGDPMDCSKYYLCINGQYIELTCPEPLFWNKNHCDWPEKSSCKNRANLRITDRYDDSKAEPIIACYFTNWAYYRQADGSFGPEQVDPSLCTHIVYAWAHLNEKSYKIESGNQELDIDNDFFGKMTELRQNGFKVILGVGGLEDSEGDKWRQMASDPQNRKAFVSSATKFVRRWGFDGLQIAWQYPVCKQAPCSELSPYASDKDSFSTLLLELSGAMRANNFELSALVSANPEIAKIAYDNNVLAEAVDWIAVAANDYYSSFNGKTEYLVQLEPSDEAGVNSFSSTLSYWAGAVPARRLVLGAPAYARSYALRRASRAPAGAPAAGAGVPGDATGVPGFLAYYEICAGVKSGDWQESRTIGGTYAVRGTQWASYLTPEEMHRVATSAAAAGVRGAALWALDLDDWRGRCGCGTRPLLTALRRGLLEPSSSPPTCL